ncbi:MAG TPA: hypothetical protein EYG21_02305 [Nitrospinaceae bacterium]|nr:hypothetical protein [Nitrospinaceae bacterium]
MFALSVAYSACDIACDGREVCDGVARFDGGDSGAGCDVDDDDNRAGYDASHNTYNNMVGHA